MISIESSVVKIDEIDHQDRTFKISTDTDLHPLTESIRQLGLITPPLLLQKKSRYILVSGFRRIAACRNLTLEQINAGIVDDGLALLDCAKVAIAENSFQRELNLIETSRALNLLAHSSKTSSEISTIAQALNLPQNLSLIKKIQKIDRLPGFLQESLLHHRISMDMAFKLNRLKEDESSAFLKIFNELRLSRSKQKELMTHIEEISIRDDISIRGLLTSKDIQDVLDNQELDRTQKTKRMRDIFKQKRYPHLYACEKQFFDSLKHINTGNRVSLKPPDYFEGDSFTLHMSFKDHKELNQHLKALEQIKDTSILTRLINKK
jgi:ParB family chromosome partitioning protein